MADVDAATVAADAEMLVRMQPREVMAQIHQRTAELARLELRVLDKKRELKELEDDRNTLARQTLPALFDHLHTDRIGVPGQKADVVLKNHLHAAILRDWDEEQRAAAFAELERLGGDDLLRCTVSVSFEKKEFELAAEFVRYISTWNRMGGRRVTIDKEVHWKTLTSFVRKLREKLVPMDLKALGASLTRECVIEWRT